MKKTIIIFILACAHVVAFAQEKFAQANESYANGDYETAAALYEEILQTEGQAAELYYNLGNTYYKLNEIGKSILNYERALRLRPFYKDAEYNLELAQARIIDKVETPRMFFLRNWTVNLMHLLLPNVWVCLSIAFFILFILSFFLFAFGKKLSFRKFGFRIGVFFIGLSLLTFVFAGITHKEFKEHADAIVMTGAVTVKSSPDKSGTDLFVLHEGTKVTIRDILGEWYEIGFGNGNVGWLKATNVERI